MPETRQMSSRELYFRLLRHVKPYWSRFSLAIGAMVVLALTEPAIPALLKPLLDGTFVEKDPQYMTWTPIALIGLFLIRGLGAFVSGVAFEWVAGKLVYDLRRQMFERILDLPAGYYDENSTGVVVSKLTYNVNQVTQAATKVLTVLVRDTLIVIGLIAYMLWLNWVLTTGVFVLMPAVAAVVWVVAKRTRRLSRELQATMGQMTHALEEAVRGQAVIKVFGGQAAERQRFRNQINWVRRFQLKLKVAGSANAPVVELMGAVALATLIYVGTGQTGAEPLTVGGFVAFLAALGLLFPPIKRLTGVNQPLQLGLAAAESVFGMMDEPPENETGSRDIRRARGRIAFERVSFRYGPNAEQVLSEVSFVAEPGKTIALVGPSGGGKSTLVSLLPRFYDPCAGRITLDGADLRDLTLESLRRNLSMVGQIPLLFNDSVANNMAFGLAEPPSRERLEEVARAANALEFIQALPEGFDAPIGEDGVRLSGGQRQRLAIARALMKDAPVLILDEATSALDSESERKVQQALGHLTAGRTTLVIAHRLSTIEHADEILVVKDGRIAEQGTHAELLARGGEYAALHRTQFSDAGAL